MHRVLSSTFGNSASSRRIQFHWDHIGDSGEVMTPFMQVGTYPTMNFVTLGPSELRPPFTGRSIQSFSSYLDAPLLLSFQHRAGVRPYMSCYHLAESCVFSKQLLPPLLCRRNWRTCQQSLPSLSRSYGGNLPSSFIMILSWPSFWQQVYLCRFKYGFF